MAVTVEKRLETVNNRAAAGPGKWGELAGGVYTLWR
jgi:hypothetical protein